MKFARPFQLPFTRYLRNFRHDLSSRNTRPEIDHHRNNLAFRPGTNDASVWRSVVDGNEYFVPANLSPLDIVIDVGMHIGSFSYLVLARGAGQVYGFEANKENYALARKNLVCFQSQITTVYGAVCRSDSDSIPLFFSGYPAFTNGTINTGGGDVLSRNGGSPVPAIPFDSIIDSVTREGCRRIRLLKLDCEGSEYSILMTSKRLHLIDEIVGEYHEMGTGYDGQELPPLAKVGQVLRLDGEMLATCLRDNGFAVRTGSKAHVWGKFLAWNKSSYGSVF